MNKLFTIFAGCVLFVPCLRAQQGQGRVSSIRQTEYECIFQDGKISKGEIVCCNNFYQRYDDNGRLIEEIKYDVEGNTDEKEVFAYDTQGNEISDVVYLQDGSVDYRIESKYNKKNQVTEKRVYDGEGTMVSCEKYTYDGFGNILKIIETDEKGKVCKRVEKRYNERGDILQDYCMYVGKNGFGWKEVYQYNERGRLMSFQGYSDCEFSSDGKLSVHETTQSNMQLHKYTLQYDMQLHLIQVKLFDENNMFKNQWKYTYNNNILVKKEMYDANDKLVRMWQYDSSKEGSSVTIWDGKYKKMHQQRDNAQGLLAEYYSDDNGVKEHKTYSYTYDKHGNWVSMTVYDNEARKYECYVERVIVYVE